MRQPARPFQVALFLALATGAAACDRNTPTDPGTLAPDALVEARVPALDYRYTPINVPGARWTEAYRVNARGDVVGTFRDDDGVHGFVLRRGRFETLDVPGAAVTMLRGINDRGQLVGFYNDGSIRGFLMDQNGITTFNYPGAVGTQLWDINARGEISGAYLPAPGAQWLGFRWRAGTFTPLDLPNASMSAGFGIDGHGTVVGHYRITGDPKMYGFVARDGEDPIHLDYPVDNWMSCAMGTGSHGQAVGHYWDSVEAIVYGYIWRNGEFIGTLRYPEAPDTYPTSMSPSGVVVGYYLDSDWVQHGFMAEPLNSAGR
jgi:uncharacterized membrane protein